MLIDNVVHMLSFSKHNCLLATQQHTPNSLTHHAPDRPHCKIHPLPRTARWSATKIYIMHTEFQFAVIFIFIIVGNNESSVLLMENKIISNNIYVKKHLFLLIYCMVKYCTIKRSIHRNCTVLSVISISNKIIVHYS